MQTLADGKLAGDGAPGVVLMEERRGQSHARDEEPAACEAPAEPPTTSRRSMSGRAEIELPGSAPVFHASRVMELRSTPDRDRIKVLVILGHPRKGSFCAALASAYVGGAIKAGADVRELTIAEMEFNPNVIESSPRDQVAEHSIQEAIRLIAWADHLVFVFPTWWGTMPAALKGFLDRVLMPGFAFADREDGEGWEKLLTGRSAHLLTTMDTPRWVYHWIYKAPGLNGLARATLGFCGIAPVRISIFGPIKDSDPQRRAAWLAEARGAGAKLQDGVLTRSERLLKGVSPWIAALRLQFHPMAWAAYGLGATGAVRETGTFEGQAFWLGWLGLFLLEIATVFVNEYFDRESDLRNHHFGPFTGGSRVLVDGRITPRQMRIGIGLVVVAFLGVVAGLSAILPSLEPFALLAGLAVLAIGYTAPPLKLCWHGLGEFDVALTHSFGVMLCGYVFQGGSAVAPFPWLASLPLFWAVLPAITLSGIPDYAADRAVGKRTLAVILGPSGAVRIAQGATLVAALMAVRWQHAALAMGAFAGISLVVLPHAAVQTLLLEQYRRSRRAPGRIDGLMMLSLFYIVWFVAVPLCRMVFVAS